MQIMPNNFIFCRSCGHRIAHDSQFCGECGTQVATDPSIKLPALLSSQTSRLSKFFASHASLSLVTLLVFSGLLIATLPVGWAYAQMHWQNRSGASATADSRSLGDASMAIARCNPILVYFEDSASVTAVASLLASLDASIAFGPNENGAFEVAVSTRSGIGAVRVMEALNKATGLVMTASLRQRCVR